MSTGILRVVGNFEAVPFCNTNRSAARTPNRTSSLTRANGARRYCESPLAFSTYVGGETFLRRTGPEVSSRPQGPFEVERKIDGDRATPATCASDREAA